MNFDHDGQQLSDYVSYTSAGNKQYFTRCHDFLKRHHEKGPSFAEKQLCEGPIESSYAPFYLAWHMGLIPIKDGQPCNETAVFYDIPGSGFDRIPEDTADFVEIMVDLLSNGKVSRYAINMVIEFHDFLAVRDPAQALRFVTEIVEDYASRHDNITVLLARKGDAEQLAYSKGYTETLKTAVKACDWFERGFSSMTARSFSSAFRRLRWPEMIELAGEADLEFALSADLGL